MGLWLDRIGRKPLLLACCIAFIVLPYPLFSLMLSGASLATIVVIQLLIGLAIAPFSGAGPAAIAEIFPTGTRSTYMSTGYAPVSYTHLRAHETDSYLVCRLLR